MAVGGGCCVSPSLCPLGTSCCSGLALPLGHGLVSEGARSPPPACRAPRARAIQGCAAGQQHLVRPGAAPWAGSVLVQTPRGCWPGGVSVCWALRHVRAALRCPLGPPQPRPRLASSFLGGRGGAEPCRSRPVRRWGASSGRGRPSVLGGYDERRCAGSAQLPGVQAGSGVLRASPSPDCGPAPGLGEELAACPAKQGWSAPLPYTRTPGTVSSGGPGPPGRGPGIRASPKGGRDRQVGPRRW